VVVDSITRDVVVGDSAFPEVPEQAIRSMNDNVNNKCRSNVFNFHPSIVAMEFYDDRNWMVPPLFASLEKPIRKQRTLFPSAIGRIEHQKVEPPNE
jgi:hypothetical protein